jgi:hypothetical protein
MDGYQFIASVLQSLVSLAWPAGFVTAVWLFREKLISLLPLLRLKYKDLDVSFRLDQAEKEAARLPAPPSHEAGEPTPEEQNKFDKLVTLSPRSAIFELRLELQDAIESFAQAVGMKTSRSQRGLLALTRELRKHELIDEGTSALLDDLRAIGNTAAHAYDVEITEEDARRFRMLAEQLIIQFRIGAHAAEANRKPSPIPGQSAF